MLGSRRRYIHEHQWIHLHEFKIGWAIVTWLAGKRCVMEGCMRQAYERTGNLCNNHFQERQRGGAEGEGVARLDDEEKPSALSMVQ